MRALMLLATLTVTLAACSKDDATDTSGADGADGADGTEDSGTDGSDIEQTEIDGLPNGTFLVNFTLAPVGGLLVPFQAEVQSLEDEAGVRTFNLSFKATDADQANLSETILEVTAALADDGSWSSEEATFVLPGAFAPTGSDVEVAVSFQGTLDGDAFFCGSMTGAITTFEMDLVGSTFGAVPWDEPGDEPAGACVEREPYSPIETCPEITVGNNTGFPSAGLERTFTVVAPDGWDGMAPLPLAFAFHGLGGTSAGLLDDTVLRPVAEERGLLLVVPDGTDFGGSPGWDPNNAPPFNADIQFFDDVLSCMDDKILQDRIYVTGHSNGGLMAGALLAHRADRLAAAAPFSGGVITEWPEEADKVPTLVSWGGENDEAYEQDFHALANDLIDASTARGAFTVACNHGNEHEFLPDFWSWSFEFLLAHDRMFESSPFAGGLPGSFPSYCAIVE